MDQAYRMTRSSAHNWAITLSYFVILETLSPEREFKSVEARNASPREKVCCESVAKVPFFC